MAKYKLKELCEFITDGTHQTPEYCGNDGVIFLSSKDVTERKINWDSVKYIPNALHEKLCKRLKPRKNDILLAKNGTTGVAAIVDRDEIFDVYVSLAVLRPLNVVYPKYLLYAINSPVVKRQFDAGLKGVGVPNLHLGVIKETWINVVKKEGQQKVCKVLDKIEKIIELKKQELQLLDELIKARFVEMFGNPVTNEKRWKQKLLGEITTKIGSGATPKGGKSAYQENGITLIRSMNVHNGMFEYKELAHISDEQATKLDNVALEEKDVLLNITGASVARSCVVPSKILPARVNQHVCIIRCKECIIPEFLNKLLIDDNYQELLWSIAGAGATREAITKQQVEGLQIIMPPVALQNEFMRFCKQVDKSKVAVQKSLDETQLLFDSLMQKYFG